MVRILELPAEQRPRERLLQLGPHALTDAELVAVLLSAGKVGESALHVADRLLFAVGGVPGLARSHPEQLTKFSGLGPAKVARLMAALALPNRRDSANEVIVRTLDDLAPVLRPRLAGLRHERMVVAVCDRRLRVRKVASVTDGSSSGAQLPIRDVLATVLRNDGHAFGVGHNHPSGNPSPSNADRNATKRLRVAAESVGLHFLGHLVFGDQEWAEA